MRKNKMMRLASGLLVAVLLTTSMISGTFAKYVAKFDADDSARVAKFDVEAFGKGVATAEDATIAIFSDTMVLDTLADTEETGEGNADDDDIKNIGADGKKLIAPGSTGTFNFVVENKSEVTVKYAVSYALENTANVPLEWSTDGSTWKTDINACAAAAELAIPASADDDNAKDTITMYWRWAFTGAQSQNYTATQTDITDTNLGLAGTAEPKVTITVDFEQVD